MAGKGGAGRRELVVVERYAPDPARMEAGLRLLGRLIARAYARDTARTRGNGHGDPARVPQEEEKNGATEDG